MRKIFYFYFHFFRLIAYQRFPILMLSLFFRQNTLYSFSKVWYIEKNWIR